MRRQLIALMILIPVFTVAVLAQSGRGRNTPPPAPQPKPSTAPNVPKTTVLNVPDGGKLLRQDIDGATLRNVMKNGITVLIRERHGTPLLAVNVYVKVGSLNETDEQAGMA